MELNALVVYLLLFFNGVFAGIGSFTGQLIAKKFHKKITKGGK